MRVLHLTLTKKWFDLIAKGKKRYEYRKFNHYWTVRFIEQSGDCEGLYKEFDEIYFKNGYAKNAPFMRVEWKCISIRRKETHTPENGEILPDEFFRISLGEVLEIKNWKEN